MAFGISQLVNNIKQSVSDLLSDLSGDSEGTVAEGRYPKDAAFKFIQSTITRDNWSKLSFPYTFSIINLDSVKSEDNPFSDFPLPLAPQSIEQEEPPAISIKATQGGSSVTHSGMRFKTLVIAGTTGVAPFRGTGGVDSKTGEAIFQPRQLKYKSGFEVFLTLRNWFRTYYEFKRTSDETARQFRLIFKNYKDGEFLIIELLKFNMSRNASRPFLYDYKMEFKVLGHFEFSNESEGGYKIEKMLEDGMRHIDRARGVLLRTQGILRQVESTYNSVVLEPLRKITLTVKAAKALPLLAADISSRILKNTVSEANVLAITLGVKKQQDSGRNDNSVDARISSISLPTDIASAAKAQGADLILSFNEGLMAMGTDTFPENTRDAVAQEQQDLATLPKSFFEDTVKELKRFKENAEDLFNLGDPAFDALFDRTATLNSDAQKEITQDELDVLNALNDSIIGLRMILSTNELFKSDFDDRIRDIVQRFDNKIELTANVAVRQVKLEQGMTLERLAQRELGDSNRWGEIVELNGLKPPYITDDFQSTLQNVIKVGQNILIPTSLRRGFSDIPDAKEIRTTSGMSQLERSLGSDIKLTSDFDIALTSSGDFDVVSGANNMAQAVILNLSYEKGELMRAPEKGVGLIPGRKFPDLADIKDSLTTTLLQDNRIERISGLSIRRDNSLLFLTFNIHIKNIDLPIPVSIKL